MSVLILQKMFVMEFLTSSSIPFIICSVPLTYFQIICTNSLILSSSAAEPVAESAGWLDAIPDAVVVEFVRPATVGAFDPGVWERRNPRDPLNDNRVLDGRSIARVAKTPDFADSRDIVSVTTVETDIAYAG